MLIVSTDPRHDSQEAFSRPPGRPDPPCEPEARSSHPGGEGDTDARHPGRGHAAVDRAGPAALGGLPSRAGPAAEGAPASAGGPAPRAGQRPGQADRMKGPWRRVHAASTSGQAGLRPHARGPATKASPPRERASTGASVQEPTGHGCEGGARRAEQAGRHARDPGDRVRWVVHPAARHQRRQEERCPVAHRDGRREQPAGAPVGRRA
jgi:hypothetical protein